MTARWNVWSVDDAKQRALVVDEGDVKRCTASADRRNAAAVKYEMGIRFVALPDGEIPEWLETSQ